MNLTDTTTLEELFSMTDAWASLPVSTLSEQQLALINLRNSYANTVTADKNGGSRVALHCCFICVTGA